MMAIPFFSIVIPTKNRPGFLKSCIDSVLSQSYTDYEIIIINDGQQLDTSLFGEFNIKLFDNLGSGICSARNTGMNKTNGHYLIFLDDDEYFEQDHLLHLHEFYSNDKNKNAICKTGTLLIKEGGTTIKEGDFTSDKDLLKQVWEYGASMSDYCFPYLIKEKVQFESKYPVIEDFIFINKALTLFPSLFLGQYSVLIEDHETRISYLKFKRPQKNFSNELLAIESAIEFHYNHSISDELPFMVPLKKIIATTYVYSKHAALKWDVIALLKILGMGLLSITKYSFKKLTTYRLQSSRRNNG